MNLAEEIAFQQRQVGEGWADLVARTITRIFELDPEAQILQVKEKFGGLRIYAASKKYDHVDEIISAAENESYKICEFCGQPGMLRNQRWWKTLCDKHQAEVEARIAERERKHREKYGDDE